MKRATITEAKNRLSAMIDRVRAGDSVLILDRGVPVARLEPVVGHPDADGRLQRLERAGIVRAGGAAPPVDLIGRPGPALQRGASGARAVIEERRETR